MLRTVPVGPPYFLTDQRRVHLGDRGDDVVQIASVYFGPTVSVAVRLKISVERGKLFRRSGFPCRGELKVGQAGCGTALLAMGGWAGRITEAVGRSMGTFSAFMAFTNWSATPGGEQQIDREVQLASPIVAPPHLDARDAVYTLDDVAAAAALLGQDAIELPHLGQHHGPRHFVHAIVESHEKRHCWPGQPGRGRPEQAEIMKADGPLCTRAGRW